MKDILQSSFYEFEKDLEAAQNRIKVPTPETAEPAPETAAATAGQNPAPSENPLFSQNPSQIPAPSENPLFSQNPSQAPAPSENPLFSQNPSQNPAQIPAPETAAATAGENPVFSQNPAAPADPAADAAAQKLLPFAARVLAPAAPAADSPAAAPTAEKPTPPPLDEASALKVFKRLKLPNLSDLLLLMPKKFASYALKPEPVFEQKQAARLRVQGIRFHGTRMICNCFCEHWGLPVMVVFFFAKAAEKRAFVVGKEPLVYGKLSSYSGLAQFASPQLISEDESVEVDFRIKGLSAEQILGAKQALLPPAKLRADGLPAGVISLLCAAHYKTAAAAEVFASAEHALALKYAEIYYYLKRLHEAAAATPVRDEVPLHSLVDWLCALPFRPTKAQLDAIADVRADLQKSRHKERVVMGDVGCGKSLVMFGAALSAYPARSVIMAPTSVLAAQLAAEAQRLLPGYFRVYLLQSAAKTGASKAVKKQVAEEIAAAHLIISTHAALHNDLGKIALVMIDEQQRFSTRQRAALEELKGAHGVEFSATPIPRTTAMINSSLLSYSFIKQLPFEKQIHTMCIPAARGECVMDKIREEIAAGHQAIVVYPLIEKGKSEQYLPLNDAIEYYERNFSGVYATHGKDAEKEATLAEFAARGNVLLSTTVIEVGISLPRLTVMVIVAPERYGLATLHQLRGRLGRAGLPGWCYLLSKNDFAPRLQEFCTTMDGFEIAEIDLKNRKCGDISADGQQSGEEFRYFDAAADLQIYERAKSDLIANFGPFALDF